MFDPFRLQRLPHRQAREPFAPDGLCDIRRGAVSGADLGSDPMPIHIQLIPPRTGGSTLGPFKPTSCRSAERPYTPLAQLQVWADCGMAASERPIGGGGHSRQPGPMTARCVPSGPPSTCMLAQPRRCLSLTTKRPRGAGNRGFSTVSVDWRTFSTATACRRLRCWDATSAHFRSRISLATSILIKSLV